MKKILLGLGLLLATDSIGQKGKDVFGGLNVGDNLPDFAIDSVLNYKNNIEDKKQWKQSLLILDFMTTSCVSCIEHLPVLDSIQSEFKGKVMIFAVSPEKRERIELFLQKNKIGKSVSLPFVYADAILKSYFPHQFISHFVWIYKGCVKAITYSDYVNRSNIGLILDGADVNWPVKKEVLDYDPATPLLTLNKDHIPYSSEPANVYYSAVTSNLDNIGKQYYTYIDSSGHSVHIKRVNYSIVELYLLTFNLPVSFPIGRIVLDTRVVRDKLIYKFSSMPKQEWQSKHTYCYEAVLPIHLSERIKQEKMRHDLETIFGIKGSYEIVYRDCWVLTKNTKVLDTSQQDLMYKSDGSRLTLTAMLTLLNNFELGETYVDETGLPAGFNLKINSVNLNDRSAIIKDLALNGIVVKKAVREVGVLILKD